MVNHVVQQPGGEQCLLRHLSGHAIAAEVVGIGRRLAEVIVADLDQLARAIVAVIDVLLQVDFRPAVSARHLANVVLVDQLARDVVAEVEVHRGATVRLRVRAADYTTMLHLRCCRGSYSTGESLATPATAIIDNLIFI